jgi:hypothetical protein
MAAADTVVTVSPSTQDVDEGQPFTVTIDVTPGEAISNVQVDLTYDQNLVTATGIVNGGTDPIDNTNGKIESICGFDLSATTNPGTLATVTFTANTAGQSPLDLVDVIVLNGVTSVPNDPQSGSVTVTTTRVHATSASNSMQGGTSSQFRRCLTARRPIRQTVRVSIQSISSIW